MAKIRGCWKPSEPLLMDRKIKVTAKSKQYTKGFPKIGMRSGQILRGVYIQQ